VVGVCCPSPHYGRHRRAGACTASPCNADAALCSLDCAAIPRSGVHRRCRPLAPSKPFLYGKLEYSGVGAMADAGVQPDQFRNARGKFQEGQAALPRVGCGRVFNDAFYRLYSTGRIPQFVTMIWNHLMAGWNCRPTASRENTISRPQATVTCGVGSSGGRAILKRPRVFAP